MLNFQNGESFASGVMDYEFSPIPPDNINNRIILRLKVEDVPALAVIDTGAPYLIIAPCIANRLGLDVDYSLELITIKIGGVKFSGNLFRVGVVLPASEGESQSFEATAFVPTPDQLEKWGNLPTFLGIGSCLDRIRFAIDPSNTKFYFGTLPLNFLDNNS